MEKLTPKQSVILDILKKLIAKNGYPPTVREIGKEAHLSSPATIHFHLKQLEIKGYIKQDSNKNRTLELLVPNEYQNTESNIIDVPLLGKVTAGTPIEAIDEKNNVMTIKRDFDKKEFSFDKIFPMETQQISIFDTTSKVVVNSVLKG